MMSSHIATTCFQTSSARPWAQLQLNGYCEATLSRITQNRRRQYEAYIAVHAAQLSSPFRRTGAMPPFKGFQSPWSLYRWTACRYT